MNIMQGDQYNLTFHIMIDNEEVDLTEIDKIQFKVDGLLKTFVNGSQDSEVTYDDDEHLFYFPLTEDETFNFSKNAICEIRVKFTSGVIKGARINSVPVDFASIKEKLNSNDNS